MSRRWERGELLAAFALYCRTPFGRLHSRNPDVIRLAHSLGRSPSAVAMKLCNFAGLDPTEHARGVVGLSHASQADRDLWQEFLTNSEAIAFESESALLHLSGLGPDRGTDTPTYEPEETETTTEVRVRLVQGFFRRAVVTSYDEMCAICGIGVQELLNASHIIPWRDCPQRRADPTNGIALCALHDRAFDRGLITVDESLRVVISSRLIVSAPPPVLRVAFLEVEGKPIHLPHRFRPDREALRYHRNRLFR